MLAHKATHEGKVAAEAAAGRNSFFDAKVIPSVAYADPEVAWGRHDRERGQGEGGQVRQGRVPVDDERRSLSLCRDEGVTKLLFDEATNRPLGSISVASW